MFLHSKVFKEQIWAFFCDDLETCLSICKLKQDYNIFKGGLNFTACLVIFSVIELCAGYYIGKDSDPDKVSDFLVKYFSRYFSKFNDKNFAKSFYSVFRNGLSHQWSPKASAIDMNFSDNYFIKTIPNNNREIPSLNVPIFYQFTKKALKDYENDLNNNDELRKLFEKRYNEIINIDNTQMEILKKQINNSTSTSTSSSVSSTSTTTTTLPPKRCH